VLAGLARGQGAGLRHRRQLDGAGRGRQWQGRQARHLTPLGPFRLQQVKGGESGLRDHIRKAIMEDLPPQDGPRSHDQIYLVGGSWRAIARLDMERATIR
jgi:exopolyphosphatase/pppGpp-phosphohydrolase